MYLLRQIDFLIIILLIKMFVTENASDQEDDDSIDVDEDKSTIEEYKKRKKQRPYVLQNKTDRIVGGRNTTIDEYPFIVSLQIIGDSHICGGSLIHPLWVVSASHCITECEGNPCKHEYMKDPNDYHIVAGSSDTNTMEYGQVREIVRFVKHPGFSRPFLHDDIALIKVKNPFEYAKRVQPIVLPQLSELEGRDVVEKYNECLALGWGAQKPRSGKDPEYLTEQEKKDIQNDLVAPILMIVSLPVIPTNRCKQILGNNYITNRDLCTMYEPGGRDACEGDSGGPLVCGGLLYGVTSWGHGCARRNYPGVFTRVDTYTAWIENILSGGPNIDYYSSSSNKFFSSWSLFFNLFLSFIKI